jgi:tetratricopeptide (TPR) repeat protein
LRISGSNTLPAIAAHRHIEPARLSRLVRGELDWIVMKALEKDRSRRYETANAFAADLFHYLHDEPVLACPPSATYRFRKFARRNRAALVTVLLVSSALVLGTVVSTWQAIRAEAARTAEADQRTIAEDQRHEADQQRAQAQANFEQARNAVDDYFNTVSESKLLDVPGLEPLRKELLESALRYYEGFVGQQGDDPGRLADLVVAHLRVMVILYSNGDGPDRWLPHMEQAIEILEPLVREGHDTPDVQRRMAGWFRSNIDPRHWQGNWHWQDGGEKGGRLALDRELRRYAQIWEKFVRDNPSVPEFQSDLAGIYFYIGSNQILGKKIADATRTGKRVLEILQKLSHDYPQEPRYRLDLARVYDAFGGLQTSNPLSKKEGQKYRQKALALREQVVQEFPKVAGYRTQLGLNYSAAALAAR